MLLSAARKTVQLRVDFLIARQFRNVRLHHSIHTVAVHLPLDIVLIEAEQCLRGGRGKAAVLRCMVRGIFDRVNVADLRQEYQGHQRVPEQKHDATHGPHARSKNGDATWKAQPTPENSSPARRSSTVSSGRGGVGSAEASAPVLERSASDDIRRGLARGELREEEGEKLLTVERANKVRHKKCKGKPLLRNDSHASHGVCNSTAYATSAALSAILPSSLHR